MELVADQCDEADDATAHVNPLGQLFTITPQLKLFHINQKPQSKLIDHSLAWCLVNIIDSYNQFRLETNVTP